MEFHLGVYQKYAEILHITQDYAIMLNEVML
jgi:hypothetical protein